MPKLFVFGIGGTGVRVIKSLAMLLASGVKINASEVIPIIIDVDHGGGDLSRTIEILGNYIKIKNELPDAKGFYQTKISNIYEGEGREFRLVMENVKDKSFSEYIGFRNLDDKNRKLANLLFSEDNLGLNMSVGFKGNPNLGSIVLNQFENNPDFKSFASMVQAGDKFFIISSIHGGTGSSGFPLLIKNIKNAGKNVPKSEYLKNAPLGAVTILPYFRLQQNSEPGKINSNDFISKTIAALEYYKKNLNKDLNALYYIGCNESKSYPNIPGGTEQINDAHFVELAAALSIVDFADKNFDGKTKFYEYGLKMPALNQFGFTVLGDKTKSILFTPLSKYFLFYQYLQLQINESINRQPWSNRGNIDRRTLKDFLGKEFFKNIEAFNKRFIEWLGELNNNIPSFTPFNLALKDNKTINLISNMEASPVSKWKHNFILFDELLNKAERKEAKKSLSDKQKFINMFNNAAEQLINKKFSK